MTKTTIMKIEKINLDEIKNNPNNPRFIKDDKYKKLVKSIRDFPEMLEIRPIVIDEEGIVLGGNMRLKACREAGIKEVPIIRANELTEDQKKEFILKDNQSFGDWDTKLLNDWSKDLLLKSGFEEYDLIDIWGTNDMVAGMTKELEGSNFNKDVVNVDDYIKQNILFFNELMIEFEDDEIKEAIRNIKEISTKEAFVEDIKKLILQYGKNII
jgi:hypothetical protein